MCFFEWDLCIVENVIILLYVCSGHFSMLSLKENNVFLKHVHMHFITTPKTKLKQ